MRTFTFGITAALALASIGINGCAATGAESGEEIGSASAALSQSTSNISAISTSAPDMRARSASACTFLDGSDRYHVQAGGVLSASGVTSNIYLAKNAGSWALQSAALGTARARMKVAQISATKCAVFGGSNSADLGGTASKKVDILELDKTTTPVSVKRTAGVDMAVARDGFELSTCKDNNNALHFVGIGGAGLQSVEIAPLDLTSGSWVSTGSILAVDRKDFSADTDGANHYLVAGGITAGSAPDPVSSIDLFAMTTANGTCTPVANSGAIPTITDLNEAVKGLRVAWDSSANMGAGAFIAINGIKLNGALWTNADILSVDFSGSPYDVTARSAFGAVSGAYQPAFSRLDSDTWVLFGGADAAVTSAIDKVQQYNAGSVSSLTLSAGVYQGAAAPFLSDGKADFLAGLSDPSPVTFGTLAVEISAP